MKEAQTALTPDRSGRPSRYSNIELLSKLFTHGRPTNDLGQVGLTVHCFDDTENLGARWMPDTKCEVDAEGHANESTCTHTHAFWSTSVINWRQRSTFGRAGVILAPNKNEVLCSYPADMGTMVRGCGVEAHRFQPDALAQMVEASMRGSGYNELLVDADFYFKQLPKSLAAFVFGLRGDGGEPDNIAGIYLQFLNYYNLTNAQVPLLRVEYTVPFDPFSPDLTQNSSGLVFTDVSEQAHRLAEMERLSKSKHHEPLYREGHAYREGADRGRKLPDEEEIFV